MRGTSGNLIEIEDLHFSYGTNEVLKGINLVVPRGKVVGILGVSGSGKSTILKLIGGQRRPSRGLVRVDRRVIHELDNKGLYEMRRDMGMMFQAGGLFSDMSVYDNIAFPMRELTDLTEELIRRLNDALGATSIIVTYDVSETIKAVDYAYFIHNGLVVAGGTPAELLNSSDPSVHQFIHAEPDGPVAFHYPLQPYTSDLRLGA